MHVTSLPGEGGIGDLGPAAFEWVETLARAKQSWWQLLPLGPPGSGYSPYQCYSAFAGNPDLISPARLADEGLIAHDDATRGTFSVGKVDFAAARAFKQPLLEESWRASRGEAGKHLRRAFARFRTSQAAWLEDFALFMAIRDFTAADDFTRWPRGLARRDPTALDKARQSLRDAIDQHQFVQFLFYRQLDALRKHARARGVRIIGDLPMFVSPDSADVWANPHLFLLDERRRPRVVAGVPPDYFSKSGQRWGNPLYNWPAMRRDGFDWWVRRVQASLMQCDLLRIDHFRGFEACWEIPGSAKTARRGRWAPSPGKALLQALRKRLGALPFIAEDLGLITPGVEQLRDDFGMPGMRVLQFAFGGDSGNPFLPHNFEKNSVAYTGTHDNDTVVGWYKTLPKQEQDRVRAYTGGGESEVPWAMIRLALGSVANLAVIPVQDLLELGSAARMNIPGRASGNWDWRMAGPLKSEVVERLAHLTETYGRSGA